MPDTPSHPAGPSGIGHRPLTLIAVAALVLSACDGTTEPAADQRADPATIASMRLLLGQTLSTAATVTISPSGAITGHPVVFVSGADVYGGEGDDAIALEAAFLDVGGAVVRPLVGVELMVTPADPMVLKYWRSDDFRGSLQLLRAGVTQIRLELLRNVDKKSIFGPVTLPITVRP